MVIKDILSSNLNYFSDFEIRDISITSFAPEYNGFVGKGLHPSLLKGNTLCYSKHNEEIPVLSLICHNKVSINEEPFDLTPPEVFYEYAKINYRERVFSGVINTKIRPISRNTLFTSRRYEDFNRQLKEGALLLHFVFNVSEGSQSLIVSRGHIETLENKTLLSMSIHRDSVNKFFSEGGSDNLEPKDLKLYVNTELKTNAIYRNVYKQIKKEYIDRVQSIGIDIVYTEDIDKYLYKPGYVMPTFSSTTARREYLKEISELLFNI